MGPQTVGHKRIGILTSGGDCAGLNAVIRAVVYRAIGSYGWEVLGICRSTQGLLANPPMVMPLGIEKVHAILTAGGTILGTTNKGNPFSFPEPDGTIGNRSEQIIAAYRSLNLDALIGIGGDGSLAILNRLATQGNIPLVAVPKTIDNDVGETEYCIGSDTAINIATEALDRLHFTAASHSRVMVLEVMGRDAGHIALNAGIAGGADIILIPEIPYSLERVCCHIKDLHDRGRNFCLVIVAEAVCDEHGQCITQEYSPGEIRLGGIGHYLADKITQKIGAETRVTVLGHTQRGSIPSPCDRLIANIFGVAAVDLIAEGRYGRMVAWKNQQVVDVDIATAIAHYRTVDPQGTLVKTARGLGICLGD